MDLPLTLNQEVTKKLFKLKPLRHDGLLLNVHHSRSNNKVRFINICFHDTDQVIVTADNEGNFYAIDYASCKFWGLPKLDSCTFIQFSSFVQNELLIGRRNGDILIINIDSGHVVGKLQGHKVGVENVSFAKRKYCLSSSQCEAIVWDLETNSKIQVLNLEKNNLLKFVAFIPVSSNILACFQDDLIQVWGFTKFETIKQFLPINWKNHSVKSIAFTKNGQFMVIAGYLPTLAVFDLGCWKLMKMVTLPDYIHTVKLVNFISQPFDGGSNRILSVLSGQGTIYFYDVHQNTIMSELSSKTEISKFACSTDGRYLSCVLSSGEMELYNITQYTAPPVDVRVQEVKKKVKLQKTRHPGDIEVIKQKIDSVLELEKLKAILKEYNEYPQTHRLKIWEKLLLLPNNIHQYNSIINHVTLVTFEDLYTKYPLESKLSIKDLRKLLNNLVTWCPFFASVEYLPLFAYPFVKVFQNKPLACFEAICTIILNWCQHWFEYFPLPPVNILAMIENILLEHDPELLHHFAANNITSNTYVWPLLETVFSEVLTSSEWLQLWDHVLTNEISFLLCAAAAYNITQRHTLTSLRKLEDFEFFYHNQNPNDMKKLLKTTYCLLKNTSSKLHPRQYLEKFSSLEKGNYPLFIEYPKTIIDFQTEKMKELEGYLDGLAGDERDLLRKSREEDLEKINAELRKEEVRREKEMEKACLQQLKSKIDFLQRKQQELAAKKAAMHSKNKQESIVTSGSVHIDNNNVDFENSQSNDEEHSFEKSSGASKVKEKYLKQLKELLKYKYMIDEGFNTATSRSDNDTDIMKKKYQQHINNEIDKMKKSLDSSANLKKLNISASLEVIDKFIENIEGEMNKKKSRSSKAAALQDKSIGLEREVSKLLRLMKRNNGSTAGGSRDCSTGNKISTCFCENLCPKTVRFSVSESTDS